MAAGDEHRVVISQEQLQRFAQRLETWGEELPEDEQRVLKLVLSRAASAPEPEGQVQALS